jgi:hypothetical protein
MKRVIPLFRKVIVVLTLALYLSGSQTSEHWFAPLQKKLPYAFSEIKIDYNSFELVYILNFA